jgi:ABC-type uncharacterized transport system substrate-binding protein
MNRRGFIRVVSICVVGGPRAAAAQTGKAPRIGWLTSSDIHQRNVRAFRDELRRLGYGEVAIEFRAASGRNEQIPSLAEELVRLGPDIIVVDGGSAAIIAKRTIASVPVVVGAMADPVRDGIVASLARPGGNITGFSISTGPELVGKRLELLREAVAGLTRVAIVWNEGNPASRTALDDVGEAARALGIAIVAYAAVDASGISRAFADAARSRAGGVLTIADAFFWSQRAHLTSQAARHRLAAIYPELEFVTAGGLMSYGPNVPDNFRRAAGYVDRILRGARPGDLPVERPAKFDLAINLKTARLLGLTIPRAVLLRADHVIE